MAGIDLLGPDSERGQPLIALPDLVALLVADLLVPERARWQIARLAPFVVLAALVVACRRNKVAWLPVFAAVSLGCVLPVVAQGLFDLRVMGIRIPTLLSATSATVIPSVGCPVGCNFCTTSAFFGGKGKFLNFFDTGAQARAEGGRVVAVGTTALRLLETAAAPYLEQWNIHELRLFSGAKELERKPTWRYFFLC